MPPLSAEARFVPLPPANAKVSEGVSNTAVPALLRALGRRDLGVPSGHLWRQLGVAALPLLLVGLTAAYSWHLNTQPVEAQLAAPATLDARRSAARGGRRPARAAEQRGRSQGAACRRR